MTPTFEQLMAPPVLNRRFDDAPHDAVYVGRPSKWGNPFKIGQLCQGRRLTRADAVKAFEDWLLYSDVGVKLLRNIDELRGRSLTCWCAPLSCHADVLTYHANACEVCKEKRQHEAREA